MISFQTRILLRILMLALMMMMMMMIKAAVVGKRILRLVVLMVVVVAVGRALMKVGVMNVMLAMIGLVAADEATSNNDNSADFCTLWLAMSIPTIMKNADNNGKNSKLSSWAHPTFLPSLVSNSILNQQTELWRCWFSY